MASVEELYKNFGILADAKDNAGKHEDAFEVIITGVKGEANAKRLASQFITRFFKYFTSKAEMALDAMFDLCEDADINIRKQVIKDLGTVGKNNKDHLAKITDVLVQLLQTEDSTELSLVHIALVNLIEVDVKGALNGIFSQILSGDDAIREKAVKFMAVKLKNVPADKWTAETEAYFIEESKRVLQDCTGDEFVIFMKLLSNMSTMQTLQGRTQLIEIVAEQSEMDKDFEATDPDCVDRLLQCFRQALPYFSKNVHSDKFVIYMCEHVIPVLSNIQQAEEGDIHLELLKLFAELCTFCGQVNEANVETVFNKLVEYMPSPPEEVEGEEAKEPDFSFSYVECLMYAFHQLGGKQPQALTSETNADRLKDFRIRLQYFARGVQVYIKQLRAALQGKSGDDLKTEENKIRVLALKTTNNINTLIKDLFHNPPSYKATVTLSWKPVKTANTSTAAANAVSPGQKRPSHTPITFGNGTAAKRSNSRHEERATYHPPEGKFSQKAGDFPSQNNRGGRFRGRGQGRGRGGYRGGYRGGQRGYRRY